MPEKPAADLPSDLKEDSPSTFPGFPSCAGWAALVRAVSWAAGAAGLAVHWALWYSELGCAHMLSSHLLAGASSQRTRVSGSVLCWAFRRDAAEGRFWNLLKAPCPPLGLGPSGVFCWIPKAAPEQVAGKVCGSSFGP